MINIITTFLVIIGILGLVIVGGIVVQFLFNLNDIWHGDRITSRQIQILKAAGYIVGIYILIGIIVFMFHG